MGIVAKGYVSPYKNKKKYEEEVKKYEESQTPLVNKVDVSQPTRKDIMTSSLNSTTIKPVNRSKAPTPETTGGGIDLTGWINTKAFDDGYQFGDITKTIFSTGADITLDVLRGGLNTIEGMTDTGQYLLADLVNFFDEDTANAIRRNADFDSYGAWFGTNEKEEENLLPKGWQNGLENYSLSGEKFDNVSNSIGQMGSYVMTGNVLGGGVLPNAMVTYSSSYGNAKSEAKRNGASESDARKYATVNAVAETLSEQFFNGIPGFKSAGWGDNLADKIVGKYFKGKAGKVAMTFLNSLGEGTEEILSNVFNLTGTYIADMVEKKLGNENGFEYGMQRYSGNYLNDLKDTLTSQDTWEAFFSAALSTSIVNAGGNVVTSAKYNNAINQYAKENNVSIEQAKKDFQTVLGAAVEENRTNNMGLSEQYQLENSLTRQLSKGVKQGLNLQQAAQSVRTDQENQYHRFEFTAGEQVDYKDNQIANNIIQKAQEANLNNTKKSHEIVRLAIKVAQEINTNVDFTNNQEIAQKLIENRQQELGRELTKQEIAKLEQTASQINGMKLGDNILLNTDSKQSAKYTLGHELKHFLEQNSKLNEELNEKLIEWAKLKGKYDTDYADMSTLYKQVKNANIIDEMTANYTGEFFSSEANLKAFATENPGLFTKIANYFKKLAYKVTGQKEKLLVQEINERIQKVYSQVSKERANLPIDRTSKVDMNGNEQYLITPLEKYNESVYNTITDKKVSNQDYRVVSQAIMNNDVQPGLNELDLSINGTFLAYVKNKNNFKIVDKIEEGKKLYDIEPETNKGVKGTTSRSINTQVDTNNVENIKSKETNVGIFKDNTRQSGGKTNGNIESKSNSKFSLMKTQNKKMLENEFKKLTGDSILVAEAKLGRYAFQQMQKENENYNGDVIAPYNEEAMQLYQDIKNSQKTSSYLYHSTPADRIQSIVKNGLKVGSKQNQEGISSQDKIYLSANEELAKSFTPDDSVILRISPSANLENLDYDLLGGEGSYTITNNIDPKYLQVKENGKWVNLQKSQYAKELDNSSFNLPLDTKFSLTQDNQGRTLSKEQQEFFKNESPELLDKNGNLKVYYNGGGDYTVFDNTKMSNQSKWGKGIYLTEDSNIANMYGDNVKEVYVNIENPINQTEKTIPFNKYNELMKELYDEETYREEYDMYENDLDLLWDATNKGNWADYGEQLRNIIGVDGLIIENSNPAERMVVAFNSDQIKNVSNKKPTSNPDIRFSLSAGEANTGVDNDGRTLSQGMQEYMKDSKATDENGNLIVVYHTTTDKVAQFNEFNPVGTDYYKFGDQVVNYFTDDKNMSGSYADQHYKMADTKKITSLDEAERLVRNFDREYNDGKETCVIKKTDNGYQLVNNIFKNAYENAKRIWEEQFTEEEKQIEKDYEELYKRYVESGYNNNLVPEFTSLENYAKDYALKLDAVRDILTPEERNIFTEIRRGNDGNFPDYITVEPVVIAEYSSKEQLFRNLKQDLQRADYSSQNRLQYEGYVNITNPYIIDAEGRTWNKVESKADSDFTKELLKVTKEDRQYLESLASDSIKTYNDNLFNYQQAERAINDFAVDRENTTLEQRLIHTTIHDLGFEDFMKVLNNEKEVYWGRKEQFMDDAYNNGFATYKQKQEYDRTGNIPTEVLDKINKLIHEEAKYEDRYLRKELEAMGMPPEIKTTTIYDLWNNQDKAYKTFDEGGRYEYSKFNKNVNEKNMYRAIENEALFKVAKKGFTDENIRLLYNDWSVTNDIVKSIIELNKVGENYDGIIIKNVVDYGGESDVHEAHDLYITFNSNQFKAIDNENPTEDADIRYQLGEQNTTLQDVDKTSLSDLKVKDKNAKPNLPIAQETNLPTAKKVRVPKTEAEKRVRDKVKKAIENQSYKAVNIATKTGQRYLDFDRKQKAEFKEALSKYIGKTRKQLINVKTWNDIQELVNKYANKEITYVDEELKSIKDEIRKQNIKITDDLKNQITDYNDFRKSNFGKLKLGEKGTSVDSLYQELSESYPYYFGEATTEADMLYEISDFMNQDTNMIQKFKLDDEIINEAVTKTYNALMQNTMTKESVEELTAKLEAKMNERTRAVIQQELLDEMGITLEDIAKGKDISAIDTFRTDPIRLNEKVFGNETGNKINDATIRKTKHNEAERTRWLNQERNEIKDLGIKARSKESAAVQKYGEKEYINKYGETVKYGDAELAKEFSDVKTQEKIKKAAQVLRQKYDMYIDQINAELVNMGYKPIQKRNDYMRHFQALNDVFSRFGTPLNREAMQNDALPTDINGLTDQFKPGKQYFASALQRMGMKTEYDAITGIDGYLEGASNLIYHTADIQRYRTLAKLIRNTYGTTHGYDDFATMTPEQQTQRIEDIQSNKLSKYAAWLDEQANALAGKKGKIDRGVEEALGRKVYNVLDTAKKQVGSNMTGYNVRSALTNFASAVQGASKTNKLAWIKGTISTINNIIHNDGLINKSDFLTSRFGSDGLAPKLWQKLANKGQIFMQGTDYFTANQIWRSKYYENLQKGMTENEAIKQADDFAARIMGDRSKGATASAFNSKTLGFFTQFQLEVNNQWSSLIHDNKIDIQNGTKSVAGMLFQAGELFGLAYLFNGMMKALTGSKVMIDPIELFKKIFAPDDDDDRTTEERAREALGDVVDDLPFISFFTGGGRIPVTEAFKGLETAINYATGQKNSYGQDITLEDVKNDTIESALYWLLPTGYSQIRKTTKGLGMYNENLPIAGSYTKSGRLRFEAEDTTAARIQAALFGEYASQNAREYLDKGYQPLTENQIQEVVDSGLKVKEYRKYKDGLKQQETTEDKVDYIANLPYSTEQKNVLVNNALNRKEDIDLTNYNEYGNLAEFDYANKNPQKYAAIKQVTSYDKYLQYKDEIDKIKEQYSNTNQRKAAVQNYINSLKLNKYQKIMLQKLAGGYSIKNYEKEMFKYINSLQMTKKEKETLHKELFG